MIQDIWPHSLDNAFDPNAAASPESPVFAFPGGKLLCAQDAQALRVPPAARFPGEELRFLFKLDGESCFYAPNCADDAPDGYEAVDMRALRDTVPARDPMIFAAYTALHLHKWYRTVRHCGICGAPTIPASDERAMDCPVCRERFYPRINPAVIVGVTNGDKLLLTRYANRNISYHALIAGFVEIGETLEQTVEREVMEETGLRVRNIRYYKSQPWGMASDILSGFYCDVDGPDDIRMDAHELKEALWVPRNEIIGQPNQYSLTNEMMLRFRDGEEC